MDRKDWRPRDWAREICKLPTLAERRAFLDLAPEKYKALIKSHVTNHFNKAKDARARASTISG